MTVTSMRRTEKQGENDRRENDGAFKSHAEDFLTQ